MAAISRVSTLTEAGDMAAETGSRSWAIAVRNAASALIQQGRNDLTRLETLLNVLKRTGGFERLDDGKGRRFRSWSEFCKCPAPFGLGYDTNAKAVAAFRIADDRQEVLRQIVAELSESELAILQQLRKGDSCG